MEQKITIDDLKKRFADCVGKIDVSGLKQKISQLEQQYDSSDFWQDPQKASRLMEELAGLKQEASMIESLEKKIGDAKAMAELSREAGSGFDGGMNDDLLNEMVEIEKAIGKLELKMFLSGQHDRSDAIITVRAGQGGTEAMDWAEILERMYLRYAERKNWKTDVIDLSKGEEAGIKSVTFQVFGPYAYGYLKGEAGVHRLVRQSPFNADKLRQTSFAQVEVLPVLEENVGIEIKEDDLEWDFFRASSQGGQNVQKVSSAVRLRHKPTGIVITSQSERFQERNRKNVLDLLRAKLWVLAEARVEEEKSKLKGEHKIAGWGNQIRSYVLHPYKMVKDLRTEVEVSDPDKVLDGELDLFVEAELKSVV